MLRSVFNIIQGWFYYFFKNPKVEAISNKRTSICTNCKFVKFYNKIDEWKYNEFGLPKNPDDLYCSQCNRCPISKLTRSPKSKCPKKYW